ncbi:MAG: ATP-binding protein, partial [Stellaceae bacterium]
MVARVRTVAFHGVEVIDVEAQVTITAGLPGFAVVGLPDKAVAESRERVRAALAALGLALPPRHITVNLSPADVLKEGGHFDLPIALGLLAAMGILPGDELGGYVALGELALDGSLTPVAGVLLAALAAAGREVGVICPLACGGEAAWAGEVEIIAAPNLLAIINHFKGTQLLPPPEAKLAPVRGSGLDLRDVKGQESAKRALEIAAAGGHNMLMTGPPGSGKSMLAARLPGILPPLDPAEALELGMIMSVSGGWRGGGLMRERPFRDPHHSASLPALVGGGPRARQGEIS